LRKSPGRIGCEPGILVSGFILKFSAGSPFATSSHPLSASGGSGRAVANASHALRDPKIAGLARILEYG
jgi:hypothetical protein